MDKMAKIVSMAPAAPCPWPSEPFIELTHGCFWLDNENTLFMARTSIASPKGVEVA
jgi:hypothetical protein